MTKKNDDLSKKQERNQRLSEALRLNLFKRKNQQRVRETTDSPSKENQNSQTS